MMIDSHCHLHDKEFAHDIEEVLERARKAHISHFITIGCDIETSTAAKSLSEHYEQIYFSAGFHPHEAKHLNDESLAELKLLAHNKKCLAIGECGLDYYYEHSDPKAQKKAFICQIELAHELNLPLIIHLRDAFSDCIEILKAHKKPEQKTLIHCFSGTLEEAKIFEALGAYLSIPGIITFKKPGALLEVVQEVALDRLLIETDCPWLAPHPFRGKRNEPAYIKYTLEKIAEARKEDINFVSNALYSNTLKFFNLT
jgi:TatD DNase family protein